MTDHTLGFVQTVTEARVGTLLVGSHNKLF